MTDQAPSQPQPTASPDDRAEIECRYLERVREECRDLDSEGVDQRRAELSKVFVMLEAVPSRRRESVADVAPVPERVEEMGLGERLAETFGLKQPAHQATTPSAPPPPAVPLSQALKKHQHLVILGEPGTGKTTLLQFVALCFASDGWGRERLDLDEARLPVRIALKTYDGVERLDRFIMQQIDRAYVPIELGQAWLTKGRLAILVDGLDEVQEGKRAAVLTALQRFAATPEGKNSRIVLTSRIAGYTGITDFGEYTIKPLTGPTDAQAYVVGWLHALKQIPPEAAQTEAEALLTKMQQQPGLRRVLTNPLLLHLAVAVFVDTGQVAVNRAELYRRYVEEVAWNRAQQRADCLWSQVEVETVLETVAWMLQTKGPQTFGQLADGVTAARPDIETSADLVTYLHEPMGLLAVYGYEHGKLVGFRHLTFQEYYVARALQRAWADDSRRVWRFLRPRLHHPAWREPILLLSGLLNETEATKLVRWIWKKARSPYESDLYRDLLLAAKINAGDASIQLETTDKLICSLVQLHLDLQVKLMHRVFVPLGVLILLLWYGFRAPPPTSYIADLIGLIWVLVWLLTNEGSFPKARALLAFPERWSGKGRNLYLQTQLRDILGELLGSHAPAKVWQKVHEALSDSDPRSRQAGAFALGKIRDERAAGPLIRLLTDEDHDVRKVTAEALGEIGDTRAVGPLTQNFFNDDNMWVRQASAKALGEIGDAQAAEALIRALSGRDQYMRLDSARALGKIGDVRAYVPLTCALDDYFPNVREAAKQALDELDKLGDAQIRRAIVDYFLHETLARPEDLPEPPSGPPKEGRESEVATLIQELKSRSLKNRISAAKALGEVGDAQVVVPLIQALQDRNPSMRSAAARALGEIGHAQGVAPLLLLLGDKNRHVPYDAAIALAKIGRPAVSSLMHLRCDENPRVRASAITALGLIKDPQCVDPLIEALSDDNRSVRLAAVGGLNGIRPAEAVLPLVKALGDEDRWVRMQANHPLVMIVRNAGGDAVLPVIAGLKVDNNYIRQGAAEALGHIGDVRVVAPLIQALEDADRVVRQNAASALERNPDARAVAPLIEALNDMNRDVRRNAALALGKIADSDAIAPLIRSLCDVSWVVREATVLALAKFPVTIFNVADSATARRLWLHLTSAKQDVRDAAMTLLNRLETQRTIAKVTALGDNPQLFATTADRRRQRTILLVLSAVVAAISSVTLSRLSSFLGKRFDLDTDTLAIAIVAVVFLLVLSAGIWITLRLDRLRS